MDTFGDVRTQRNLALSFLCAIGSAVSAQDPANRPVPTAAVADFATRGLSTDEALALTDRFQAELARCGSYRLVERTRIGDVLKEQGFQQTGCTSTECAVQTGKLLGVGRMLAGAVSQVGRTWTVQVREVDVQTGEILRVATIDHAGAVDELLTSGMYELARKISPNCPAREVPPAAMVPPPAAPPPPEPVAASPLDSIHLFAEDTSLSGLSSSPFQVAFISPAAFPPARRVHGIAVDVFYGRLTALTGIQAGLVNRVDSTTVGIQAGLFQDAGTNRGIQAGLANRARELRGMQTGVVNTCGASRGVQAGLVSVADTVHGAQFGGVNLAGPCKGIQVGIWNVWKTEKGDTWYMPGLGCLF